MLDNSSKTSPNQNNKRRGIMIAILVCSLILVGILSSYAFFITNGAIRKQEVDLQTGTMALVFSDRNNEVKAELNFGESVEKTFTLENTGTVNTTTTMYWDNLINTYETSPLGTLTYTLEYATTPDGEYKSLVNNQNVPSTDRAASAVLAESISVPAKKTYYYKLTITLNYLEDVDQTNDLGAHFSSQFKIGEGSITDVPFNVVDAVIAMEKNQKPKGVKSGTPNFSGASESTADSGIQTYGYDGPNYYNNITIIKNDEINPFNFNEYGEFSSTNEDTGTTSRVTFSVGETFNGGMCYDLYDGNQFYVYVDNTVLSPYNPNADISTDGGEAPSHYFCVEFENIKPDNQIEFVYKNNTGVTWTSGLMIKPDSGVYEMEDDYGTSYYFRGDVQNNYLRFGGNYWRVIRVNGDGSVRIMYDGTRVYQNGERALDDEYRSERYIAVSRFNYYYYYNSEAGDAKYVGYMYGPANETERVTTPSTSKEEADSNIVSSDIKLVLEDWYQKNIVANNADQYIADTSFCYDRSISTNLTDENRESGFGSEGTMLGYGQSNTLYGVNDRLHCYANNSYCIPVNPTLKCPNKNDAFTKSDSVKGNAKLGEKVGLINADEVMIAGDEYSYLVREGSYWTGTPYEVSTDSYPRTDSYLITFSDDISGAKLTATKANSLGCNGGDWLVAPVINLTPEYVKTMTGSGLPGDEYIGDAVWELTSIKIRPNIPC